MLDLSTVGPATRCSRLLADYGARVVKVGAPPKAGATPIVPPFHAYSGQRGLERAEIDLKAPAGRDAFLRLAADADVVIESFRPGVVDRLGIGYEARAGGQPWRRVLLDQRLRADRAVRRAGRPRPQLPGRGRLPAHVRAHRPRAGRRCPAPRWPTSRPAGCTPRPRSSPRWSAGRAPARAPTSTSPVADGVLWMLSLYIDEYLATGEAPGPGHYILTGPLRLLRRLPRRPTAAGWRWPPSSRRSGPTCAVRSGSSGGSSTRPTTRSRTTIRADLRRVFAERSRDEWVALLADADTCVAPVLVDPRGGDRSAGGGPGGRGRRPAGGGAAVPTARRRCWPAPCAGRPTTCLTRPRPVPRRCSATPGVPAAEIEALAASRGDRMTTTTDVTTVDRWRRATPRRPTSPWNGATSGRPAPRSRTGTRCSGTTPWPTT